MLYLDYPEYRLIRTLDSGKTWENLPVYLHFGEAFRFIGFDKYIFTYNQDSSGIFYSDDLFSTIHQCTDPGNYTPTSNLVFATLPDSQFVVYASMEGIGVMQGLEQCDRWVPLPSQPNNIDIHSLAMDPNSSDIMYAGTNDGVYITVDAGEHWGLVTEGLLGANLIYSLGVDSMGKVLAVTPYGIFKLEGK